VVPSGLYAWLCHAFLVKHLLHFHIFIFFKSTITNLISSNPLLDSKRGRAGNGSGPKPAVYYYLAMKDHGSSMNQATSRLSIDYCMRFALAVTVAK